VQLPQEAARHRAIFTAKIAENAERIKSLSALSACSTVKSEANRTGGKIAS